MKHAIESSKLFPIISWSLIVGFGAFTWTLTLHLKSELSNISMGVERVEARLDAMEKESISTPISTSTKHRTPMGY
ncbi:MAG TPA: hypothetical protein VFV22_00935 [Candidatus Paceibacterota bacterium]|nr:hypothetical protein [Candidatus Paceibacterota bacterium]